MPRKPRPNPMEQGSIAEIGRLLFPPIQFKPEAMGIAEWHEMLLHVKERDIIRYTARKAFKMPGVFWLAPLVKVQGIGFRAVAPGDVLYARLDSRFPDLVDVEFLGGREGIFTMSGSEWNWCKLHLDESERVKK